MRHFHFLYGNTLRSVSASHWSWNCSFAIRGIPSSFADKPFFLSLSPSPLFLFFVLWELRAEPVRCFSSEALCIDSLWGGGRFPPTASFLLGSDCRLTVLKEHEGVREWVSECKREIEREREIFKLRELIRSYIFRSHKNSTHLWLYTWVVTGDSNGK